MDIDDVLADIDFNENLEGLTAQPLNPAQPVSHDIELYRPYIMKDYKNEIGDLFSRGPLAINVDLMCKRVIYTHEFNPIINEMIKIYKDRLRILTERLSYYANSHLHNLVYDIKEGSTAEDKNAWLVYTKTRSQYNQHIRDSLSQLAPMLYTKMRTKYNDLYGENNDLNLAIVLRNTIDELKSYADTKFNEMLALINTQMNSIIANSHLDFSDVGGYTRVISTNFNNKIRHKADETTTQLQTISAPLADKMLQHITAMTSQRQTTVMVTNNARKIVGTFQAKTRNVEHNLSYIDNSITNCEAMLSQAEAIQIDNTKIYVRTKDVLNMFTAAVAEYPRTNVVANPERMQLYRQAIRVQTVNNIEIKDGNYIQYVELASKVVHHMVVGQCFKVYATVNFSLTDLPNNVDATPVTLTVYCNDGPLAFVKSTYTGGSKRMCINHGMYLCDGTEDNVLEFLVDIQLDYSGMDNVDAATITANVLDKSEMTILAM
ncbi:hypothetical protein ECIV_ORF69 [European chub iridovirus]|nr:hypothetical protein ECIV_ORF69 [European chub iridovirus]